VTITDLEDRLWSSVGCVPERGIAVRYTWLPSPVMLIVDIDERDARGETCTGEPMRLPGNSYVELTITEAVQLRGLLDEAISRDATLKAATGSA
jgi:hypothetical protein